MRLPMYIMIVGLGQTTRKPTPTSPLLKNGSIRLGYRLARSWLAKERKWCVYLARVCLVTEFNVC